MIKAIGSNAESIRGNAEKMLWKIIQSELIHRPALPGLNNNTAVQNCYASAQSHIPLFDSFLFSLLHNNTQHSLDPTFLPPLFVCLVICLFWQFVLYCVVEMRFYMNT